MDLKGKATMIGDMIQKITIAVIGCAVAIPLLGGIFIYNLIDYMKNKDYYNDRGNNGD